MSDAVLTAKLTFQLSEVGGGTASLPLSSTIAVTERQDSVLRFTGVETDRSVNFGTVANAKILVIENNSTLDSVTVKINGSATALTIGPKGKVVWMTPSGGITSLTVSYTATNPPAEVHVVVWE